MKIFHLTTVAVVALLAASSATQSAAQYPHERQQRSAAPRQVAQRPVRQPVMQRPMGPVGIASGPRGGFTNGGRGSGRGNPEVFARVHEQRQNFRQEWFAVHAADFAAAAVGYVWTVTAQSSYSSGIAQDTDPNAAAQAALDQCEANTADAAPDGVGDACEIVDTE